MAARRGGSRAPLPRGVTSAPGVAAAGEQLDLALVDDHETYDGVRCDEGVLVGRTVSGLSLRRAVLAGCRLTGVNLVDAELADVVLRDCDLSGADLTRARLRRVTFERCRLSGLVAPEIEATDVRIADCRAEEAWLRMARLEHCEIVDGDLTGSDWYGARVTRSRLVRTRLDGSELSTAVFADVALHGSSLSGVRGADLRDVVIGSDQVVELAVALFATRNVRIDDDADDPEVPAAGG